MKWSILRLIHGSVDDSFYIWEKRRTACGFVLVEGRLEKLLGQWGQLFSASATFPVTVTDSEMLVFDSRPCGLGPPEGFSYHSLFLHSITSKTQENKRQMWISRMPAPMNGEGRDVLLLLQSAELEACNVRVGMNRSKHAMVWISSCKGPCFEGLVASLWHFWNVVEAKGNEAL